MTRSLIANLAGLLLLLLCALGNLAAAFATDWRLGLAVASATAGCAGVVLSRMSPPPTGEQR